MSRYAKLLYNLLHPVTRIEMTGTEKMQRITRFGKDGEFLDTTITAPPSMPTDHPLP